MEIEEADMRAIVRLLGEASALPGGLMNKKLFLLDGLCDLADARQWAWTLTCSNQKKRSPSFCGGSWASISICLSTRRNLPIPAPT